MQKFILEGEPKEVEKVIQENRIRVERGVIAFTPVQPETALDDTKDVPEADTKDSPSITPKKTRTKKSE